MPRITIAQCRPFVQARKEFTASTLHAKWEEALDGTKIYVVRSVLKTRGFDHHNNAILFAYHDGVWCEQDTLPFRRIHIRRGQMYSARPTSQTVRMQGWNLRAFVREGMAHHPKMARLLAVSV